jgi:hypothetical protein
LVVVQEVQLEVGSNVVMALVAVEEELQLKLFLYPAEHHILIQLVQAALVFLYHLEVL